jgi:hypothetical protein
MEPASETVSRKHFHIRWVRTRRLDWESFATSSEAVSRAQELARPGEEFEIEEFDQRCTQCGPLSASAG